MHGTIDELVDEISSVALHVILSSEDFECSIHHHERFSDFIGRLRRCGFDVKLILYLRNQCDYSQSLYVTMLKFGVVQSFGEFVDDIIDNGLFRWYEWIFQFSYSELVARLQAFRDVEVIVRSYDALRGSSVIGNFLSILDLTSTDLGIDEHLYVNGRPDVASALAQFYTNRKGAPPDPIEQDFIASLFDGLKGRAIDISSDTKERIAKRFGHSAPSGGMAGDELGQDGAGPLVEAIFSLETCQRIADQSKMRRERLQHEDRES
jgi:hypothetical protein